MALTKNITAVLTAFITATEDASNNVVVNRGTGNPSVDDISTQYSEQLVTGAINVDTAVPLAATNVDQLYIRNLDAAADLTIKGTPQGGAAATLMILRPGGQFIFWNTATGKGLGTVTVASSVGATGYEIFSGATI